MIPTFNSVIHTLHGSFQKCVKPLAAIGLSVSLLSGCSFLEPYKPTLTQGTVISHEAVDLLQEGLTKDQTRQLCGPPMGQDPFNPNHWDYAFYTTDDSFHPDAVKRLSIYFDEDGMIESWKTSDEPIDIQLD